MRTFIGAVAALSAVVSAGAAQAQSQPKTFYMRQVIKNIKTSSGSSTSNPSTPTPPPTTPTPTPSYTYTPGYSGYSTCDNGSQYASMTSCTRSDGQQVANSFCTGAGHPATKYQSCTPPVTYTVHDHGYGACTNGQRPHYRDCLGSDGSEIYIRACANYDNPTYESC